MENACVHNSVRLAYQQRRECEQQIGYHKEDYAAPVRDGKPLYASDRHGMVEILLISGMQIGESRYCT